MPFDMFALAAMTDEVNSRVAGGQVQRILQPGETVIGLAIYARGSQQWLLLSAEPQTARVSFATDRLAKAFPTPSPFVMALRKHLEGRRLTDAAQIPSERILVLATGGDDPVRLIAEIMGKHSNVILVDGDDRILGALKNVPPRQSRVRPILPGQEYRFPPEHGRDESNFPAGPRVDPSADLEAALTLLQDAPGSASAQKALLGLLPGASPFLAAEIARRAGLAADTPMSAASPHKLLESAASLYRLLATRNWQPTTFENERGRCDFAPYLPIGQQQIAETSSMSEAVEYCLGGLERTDVLAAPRAALLRELERARSSADRRVASMQAGLAAAGEADEVRTRGQLLLAYSYAIQPGDDSLTIPDLELSIPLDPALTPQGNAEKAFRRYAKLRDAASRLPALIAEAEAEASRLADLEVFVRLADSEATLRDLRREIAAPDTRPETRRQPKRGPLHFRRGTYRAVVGRNAAENEQVTFRLAGRDDLWLHARERTGAHVILRDGLGAPDEIVLAAAALAAYYSEGRTDSRVPVDVTLPRSVRKIPGGPAGRVTYRDEKTMLVAPELASWEPEKR